MSEQERDRKEKRLAAFEQLVSCYEAALLRYATRILSDSNGAQDVVQESFVKLLKAWPDAWEPSPQLASWLYRVTHNGAVDHLRRESRRFHLHQREAEERPESTPPNRGPAFHLSEEAEQAAAALKTLSLREQQLVILKVYEEKSYKEISEITGLTVSNVGYILHHAMKHMAAYLQEQGKEKAL